MRVSKTVENILGVSREARNSDKVLYLEFMDRCGIYLTPDQRQRFKQMPGLETISRVRRKLQEQGRYLADQVIGQERRFKGYSMQQSNPKADKIEDVIDEPRAISWLDDEDEENDGTDKAGVSKS